MYVLHHPVTDTHLILYLISPSASAFKLLLIPLVLYANWQLLAPYAAPGVPNPFAHIFLLAGRVSTSSPDDPRYAKSWWDLVFVAYYIIFWSFIRQSLTTRVLTPLARYFRLKKPAKVDRFCEQGYALVYFTIFGFWGYVSRRWSFDVSDFQINDPSAHYDPTTHILVPHQCLLDWSDLLPSIRLFINSLLDYPHWDMKPELKCYYLVQSAYWCQQLIVLVLGLEKPRKDYPELVAHHIVTLWLVGYVDQCPNSVIANLILSSASWSYLINLTLIGNAVFMSMDIPDAFLAFSKLLNYIQWERAKVISFVIFVGFWTWVYFTGQMLPLPHNGTQILPSLPEPRHSLVRLVRI